MVNVIFIHPDLGIGGAERLVVDAALALQKKKHSVQFFTAHHDRSHCFPETVNGQLKVTSVGDWLPRSTFGLLTAFWAYLRMIYVALYVVFFSRVEYEVAFVDQVSVCIPVLCLRSSKVLFYCHFPDQLLAKKGGLVKKAYRYFINHLEEVTTRCADCILVNSHFTASVFKETFQSIAVEPAVLYPTLMFSNFDSPSSLTLSDAGVKCDADVLFLSINRYERKKNLGLALKAFSILRNKIRTDRKTKMHLVIAGGYDARVRENVEHFDELVSLSKDLNLQHSLTFLQSPPDDAKVVLLKHATCLLYTPDKEHFGIVPVEAMYAGTPVIAVNSGGPKETVIHNETGILCDPTAENFAEAMQQFCEDTSLKREYGKAGHEHIVSQFSFDAFADNLHYIVQGLADERKVK